MHAYRDPEQHDIEDYWFHDLMHKVFIPGAQLIAGILFILYVAQHQ